MKLIDKSALVVRVEKLQSEIAEEKKLHEDNSMWYNGINHGFNLTKDILNTLEVKDLQEEPVSKDYRERYKRIAQSESFREAYDGKSISEEEPSEIDFEQELYKAFGQVKDFTLGMRIAKWFYDMGKNSQEPVSNNYSALLPCIYNRTLEERVRCCKYCSAACEGRVKDPVSENLEEAALEYANNQLIKAGVTDTNCPRELAVAQASLMVNGFKAGTKWQKEKDESTTEDLGEYINELSKQFPEVSFAKLSRIAVRVAKWQKEQFESEFTKAKQKENNGNK